MTSSRHGSHSRSTEGSQQQNEKSQPVQRKPWQHVVQRAQADPNSLTPADVKILQRSIGNQNTARLLSPVLQKQGMTLGAAGDRYEQEADQVAEQVVQRQGEEEELQMKAMPPRISPLQRSFASGQDVQRQEEEEELQMKTMHGPEGGEVEQGVQREIQQLQGKGQPLEGRVRREMEQGFGRDFSQVRIHTGGQADTLNRSLNARAFTVGSDIVFRKGEFQSGSADGKKLLAHELTHTVQQGGAHSTVQPKRLMIQREETPQNETSKKDAPKKDAPKKDAPKKNLLETLFKSDFRDNFYRFTKEEFSSENVECYEAIKRYQQKPSRSVAIQIYNTYVKAGSDKELNIPDSERDAVYTKVQKYEEEKSKQSVLNKLARKFQKGQLGDPTLFDDIERVVKMNLTDTFRRWRDTPVGELYEQEFNDPVARMRRLVSERSPEMWAEAERAKKEENAKRDALKTVFGSNFRNDFYQFCKKEFSLENFECYEATQRYKQKPRRSVAIQIYSTYVKARSDKEINTANSKRDAVYAKVQKYEEEKSKQGVFNKLARKLQKGQLGDPTLFDGIQKDLLVNLQDTFLRWIVTPSGKSYMTKMGFKRT
jgi:hypothetical protein